MSAQRYGGSPGEPLTLTLETARCSGRRAAHHRGDPRRRLAGGDYRLVQPGAEPHPDLASRHVWDRSTGQSVGVYPAQRTKITLGLDEMGRGLRQRLGRRGWADASGRDVERNNPELRRREGQATRPMPCGSKSGERRSLAAWRYGGVRR
ncbi:MAG: hypothetical protein R2748_23375 [Bryobacterales bacterium]